MSHIISNSLTLCSSLFTNSAENVIKEELMRNDVLDINALLLWGKYGAQNQWCYCNVYAGVRPSECR